MTLNTSEYLHSKGEIVSVKRNVSMLVQIINASNLDNQKKTTRFDVQRMHYYFPLKTDVV